MERKGKIKLKKNYIKDKTCNLPDDKTYDGLYKIKSIIGINTDGSGNFFIGISTTNLNMITDWSSIDALYDMYKVYNMKFKYLSSVPNKDIVFKPCYVFYDPTNPSISPTGWNIYNSMGYDNVKIKSLYKDWKIEYPIQKILGDIVIPSTYQTISSDVYGYMETLGANYSGGGCVYVYVNGGAASTSYGNIIVTYDIAVKNRN